SAHCLFFHSSLDIRDLHSFPTRRSSDLLVFYLNFKYGYSLHPEEPLASHEVRQRDYFFLVSFALWGIWVGMGLAAGIEWVGEWRSEEHTSELQSRFDLVCRLLLEKKKVM